MDIRCPTCGQKVDLDDVNVARDLALCRSCERTFSFADSVGSDGSIDLPTEPPAGTSYEETFSGFRVSAITFTPFALFIVPFTLVWAGGALTTLYGKQLINGQFDPAQSLIGIPFAIGSVFLIGMAAMSLFGQVVVVVDGDDGQVFAGVGELGWRRRFSWGSVRNVVEIANSPHQPTGRNWQWGGSYSRLIRLNGPHPISFGGMLNERRRLYLAAVLKRELQRRRKVSSPIQEL